MKGCWFYAGAFEYLEISLAFVPVVGLRIGGNFHSGKSQGSAGAEDAVWEAGLLWGWLLKFFKSDPGWVLPAPGLYALNKTLGDS